MKYRTQEVATFLDTKQYVDTALVPVIQVAVGATIVEQASEAEFIQLMAEQMEKEYKGRIVLLPPFTFFTEAELKERLPQWVEALRESFAHVAFVTSSLTVKLNEQHVGAFLHYVPTVPLQYVDEANKAKLVQDVIGKFGQEIIGKWKSIGE